MTEDEQIAAIYEKYPRHVGRRSALRAIEKAVKRIANGAFIADTHDARRFLYKKVAEYALSPAGQRPVDPSNDYRPHPATWMNQDRYLDDRSEWQKPNGGNGNGRQTIGTKAERTVDSARAAIERIENRNRTGATGNDAGRRVQPDDAGDVCGRTIDGTI